MKQTLIAVLIISGIGCHTRFSKLDYYFPDNIELKSEYRTMEEHNQFMSDKEWPYILKVEGSNSSLLYYGSWHTNDPDDPQISEIEQLWNELKPTVAVTENRLGFIIGSEQSDIKSYAEFAMASILGS
ncbi:MAG: hypothetical protein ACMZ7B_07295, partial [Balneola sp.]